MYKFNGDNIIDILYVYSVLFIVDNNVLKLVILFLEKFNEDINYQNLGRIAQICSILNY